MLNFFSTGGTRYIREADSILKPLTDATHGGGDKHDKLNLTRDLEKLFLVAKVAIRGHSHGTSSRGG